MVGEAVPGACYGEWQLGWRPPRFSDPLRERLDNAMCLDGNRIDGAASAALMDGNAAGLDAGSLEH